MPQPAFEIKQKVEMNNIRLFVVGRIYLPHCSIWAYNLRNDEMILTSIPEALIKN